MKKYLGFISILSLILILGACSGNNESEGETTEESTEETTDNQEESTEEESDGSMYEIGDTAEIESFEWEVPYQVTVNSFDQAQEYDGNSLDSLVSNAGDSHFLGIVNMTVKNIADEPIVIGEYVYPNMVKGGSSGGEQYVYDLSEEDVSQELQPDEEATIDLVYILSEYGDNEHFELTFEQMSPNETAFRLPLE
ncbi:hypothetical protein WN59_11085 [Salinicoccus sediminis]|uniref:DUF4352 domain-containing protein n=1 Tax=Salinicoccus sediminis TaxID=1432562 RepID=A0A0M2SMM2_9STAP|nr:hypothetical protein [Salinicoccus sediminis]KKK34122.1 hypothetical protein WN59_11085 [Salinicoccus sediminis]